MGGFPRCKPPAIGSGARDAASGSRFIILLSLIALTVATPVDELGGSELPAIGAGGTRVVGDGPLEVTVVCVPGPMTSDGGFPTGSGNGWKPSEGCRRWHSA